MKTGYVVSVAVLAFASMGAKAGNEGAAEQLLKSLQSKVGASLKASQGKELMPWDASRLTAQCLSDELQYGDIERDVLLPWQNAWKSGDAQALNGIVTSDFAAHDWSALEKTASRTIDGIQFTALAPGKELMARDNAVGRLAAFRKSFKEIQFAELVAEKVTSVPKSRGPGQVMTEAVLSLRYDLRGSTQAHARVQERGTAKATVVRQGGRWKMAKLELVSGERLAASAAYFENVTEASGIAKAVPSHLRREAIRRGGYAMAVGDYNKDGASDLFVGTVAESVLVRGDQNQKFARAPKGPLDQQTLVKAAAFADIDNDGGDDLVLIRFAPNEAQTDDDRSDIQIYKNTNGSYVRRDKAITFGKKTAYAMPMALADFNSDGLLDFYVGFPGAKDFTTLEKAVHPRGIETQGMFYNLGEGKFSSDPTRGFAKAHEKSEDLSRIFPHSALAADFNQDGHMDLVVIDDRGNLSPLYVNRGKGEFENGTRSIGVGLMDYGMGVDVGDLNGDGKADFVMSAVNFHAARRTKASCETNWSVQDTISAGVTGLRTFEANSNGTFTETTSRNGLEWAGQGAGGVKLFDYNNDGNLDIYLTTGLWTGSESDSSRDLASTFVAASTLGILEDSVRSPLKSKKLKYDVMANNDYKSLLFHSDSQSSIMDVLSFHRSGGAAPSLAGNQRNRVFRNNGDGTFTELGFMLGVDSAADGYMVAIADLNKDGNEDLILRNADPGYRTDQFPPVEIFRNNGAASKKSVIVKLEGSASNRDAIGTIVEAKIGDRAFTRQLIGNSGTVQSERIVHFGLDNADKIDRLTVRWPSGKVQVLEDVKPGYQRFVEPAVRITKAD